ncbi:MAG: MXAN_5808 family serine peptidase [Bdellovibrionota bacterium]
MAGTLLVLTPRGDAAGGASSLSAAQVTTATFQKVSETYLDLGRIDYGKGLQEALRAIEAVVPEFEADYEPGRPVVHAQMNLAKKSFPADSMTSAVAVLDVLKKIYGFVQRNLRSEIDPSDIEYAATNGFLTVLDPHSRVLAPEIYQEFQVTTQGSFGGIGIVIGIREEKLTVISPLDGTPAARAGIRAGDRITRIEDETTENMPLDEAVRKLRGEENTVVHITTERDGESAPIEHALTRARIEIESIEGELLSQNVGYVRIKNFQENTSSKLKEKLAVLQAQAGGGEAFRGLVLDLRNNPGGLLDQAVQVADVFLQSGDIVTVAGRASRDVKRAKPFGTERLYPVVVLVNEGSASASEIVAGAIQNQGRGIVVGSQTFGKGSVQNVFELPQGGALKLTVAEYLTPGDRSIQSIGVTPAIALSPVEVAKEEARILSLDNGRREEDLEYHLSGSAKAVEKPSEFLDFLVEVESEKRAGDSEEEAEAAPPEEPSGKKLDLAKDFPAAFARRAILAAKGWQRQALLDAVRSILSQERSKQEASIHQVFSRRGLDWSSGKTALPANLDVKFEVTDAAGAVQPAALAGEKRFLRLKVTNRGTSPVYRLVLVTKSDVASLDHRQFIVGKLAPGASSTQKLPVQFPQGIVGRTAEVMLSLRADGGEVLGQQQTAVRIQGKPRPDFSISYRLVDGPPAQGVIGNGDGRVSPGETAALEVTVRNVGDGPSESSVLRIYSLSGPGASIPEGQGTVKLPALAPGTQGQGRVLFQVRPQLVEDEVKLEISVADLKMGEGIAEEIRFPVIRSGKQAPPAQAFEAAAARMISPPLVDVGGDANAGLQVNAAEIQLTGELRDDGRLKDVFVVAEGEKIYYHSYEASAGALLDKIRFNVKVPLKPGSNLVWIVARDDQNLFTRHPLYVWRGAPASGEAVAQQPSSPARKQP